MGVFNIRTDSCVHTELAALKFSLIKITFEKVVLPLI